MGVARGRDLMAVRARGAGRGAIAQRPAVPKSFGQRNGRARSSSVGVLSPRLNAAQRGSTRLHPVVITAEIYWRR